MEQSILLKKKEYYKAIKESLKTKDYSLEIAEKLEEYRLKLINEFEETRQSDIKTCEDYLHVIDECLDEIAAKDLDATNTENLAQ